MLLHVITKSKFQITAEYGKKFNVLFSEYGKMLWPYRGIIICKEEIHKKYKSNKSQVKSLAWIKS